MSFLIYPDEEEEVRFMTGQKGNLMFAQSGGPTAVINSSAAGVFLEALGHSDVIGKVYGAHHGIIGVLREDFYDIGQEDPHELRLLKQTPSSILGSCRYKLKDPGVDETDYLRLLEVFRKYNIRYFFYNGGNDSMDTCLKIDRYLKEKQYECQVIGVPKTIDNDLAVTDHCPGYGSAARYIATTMMEIHQDAIVYEKDQITIVEIMGRNAGWLTAASALARQKGYGPDLIYLPERTFDLDQFYEEVAEARKSDGKAIICVSEGLKTKSGEYVTELDGMVGTDAFGHKQLSGTAELLGKLLAERFDVKVRSIEFSLMQRCASHLASRQDVDDSFNAGREAVNAALNGESGIMIGFRRPEKGVYRTELIYIPLEEVANAEHKVPDEYISEDGRRLTSSFMDYAMPLIQGEPELLLEDSLPRFSRLKLLQAGDPRRS